MQERNHLDSQGLNNLNPVGQKCFFFLFYLQCLEHSKDLLIFTQ